MKKNIGNKWKHGRKRPLDMPKRMIERREREEREKRERREREGEREGEREREGRRRDIEMKGEIREREM